MTRFDVEVWKARAGERYRRAEEAGKSAASAKYTRDIKHINDLSRLIQWCEKRGLEVVFTKKANGLIEGKRIRVNGHCTPQHQLFLLIHECGHHLIGQRERHERYGMGYYASSADEKRTLIHRIDIVDEEFEAWDRGRKLAGRLGIKLDKEIFNKVRAKYLKTYMQWALKVNGYGGPIDGDEEPSDQT